MVREGGGEERGKICLGMFIFSLLGRCLSPRLWMLWEFGVLYGLDRGVVGGGNSYSAKFVSIIRYPYT